MAVVPGHDPGVFNFGAGEIAVLCLLALIFLGPKKLPDLAPVFRAKTTAPAAPRWSWSEWLLVCAALVSGAIAVQLRVGFQR